MRVILFLAALLASGATGWASENDTAKAPLFVDRAAESGIDFVHFSGVSGEYLMAEINSAGCGLVDYDGDGDLDLYLVQGTMLSTKKKPEEALFPPQGPLHDRLYRNELEVAPDGSRRLRFVDVTEAAGIVATSYGYGVATGDYDNDGWVDLYVTNLGSNHLFKNDGDGTFTDVTEATHADDRRWSVSAAFLDYDRDGWLDLYIGNYLDYSYETNKVCRTASGAQDYCGPTAYVGVGDRLLHNNGDGTFVDVSIKSGIHRERSKALGVVVADFNGDGWVDIYVANDGTPNQMWMNQKDGTFIDDALLAGSAVNLDGKAEASMGVDAADFDGDGDEDLFMTHLVAETNTLYKNDGAGMFEDLTIDSGLGVPSWKHTSWGTRFFDYDNDGWLDLIIMNGAVRTVEELATRGDPYPFHETNQLFHNDGGGTFVEVTAEAGPVFELSEVSRGAAFGDIDNDGDTDVVIANNSGPTRVLVNEVGNARTWLGVRLVDTHGRDAVSALAVLERPGQTALTRRLRTDGSFASANDPRILFGLGEAARVGPLRVDWPSGRVETFTDLEAGRYTTLREGSGEEVRAAAAR